MTEPDFKPQIGALRSDPDVLANAWPVRLALAAAPVPAPAKFHSPLCRGVTLNQNPFGACVAYSGAYVQASLEVTNEGRDLLPGVLDPLHTYALVKDLPWPLTRPAQDPNPGLNPPQLWAYTKKIGWATKDGSAPRKDASYLLIGKPSSSAQFLNDLQQTLLQLGPCQFTASWPHNWYDTDTHGYMLKPVLVIDGGHAFECCGWEMFPNGTFDTFHHQTWGSPWGHDPEFPNHFRVQGVRWNTLGWEAWKVADVPNPPAPVPPAPIPTPPEVQMIPTKPFGSLVVGVNVNTRGVDLNTGALVAGVAGKTFSVLFETTLVTPLDPSPDSAHVYAVAIGTQLVGILARNCTFTPAVAPAADRSYLVHLNVPGDVNATPTITKA